MATFENILFEQREKIATITLNRPEKRNAFHSALVADLKEAFSLAESDKDVKVIVLAAMGPVFSAGADLSYLQQLQDNSYAENLADSESLMALYKQVYLLEKPVIAKVQGHAIAGGCGLVTVCDFAIAAEGTKFGYTEVRIGFVPAIVMVFLLRKVGELKAKELLLTGTLVNAARAVELGLVNTEVKADMLTQAVDTLAQQIIQETSRTAVTATKQLIARIQELDLDAALKFAAEVNASARATEDCRKGIGAFLNKEDLHWD